MLIGQLSHYFFGITIFLTSLFLVLLVLVQRGRGGGIAGALGGAGGQSAFGTKAGDLFTRITVGVAAFWILMCCLAIAFLKTPTFSTGFSGDGSKMESDDTPAVEQPMAVDRDQWELLAKSPAQAPQAASQFQRERDRQHQQQLLQLLQSTLLPHPA